MGAILGALCGGFITEKKGYKSLFMFTVTTYLISTLALSFQNNKIFLHILRFICGIQNGLTTTLLQPYVAELCEPKVRGFLTSFPEIFLSAGILITYFMAKYLSWQLTTFICTIPPIVILFSGILVPEVSLRFIFFKNQINTTRFKNVNLRIFWLQQNNFSNLTLWCFLAHIEPKEN